LFATVTNASQSATLSANTAYNMTINTTGSCFAYADCTNSAENVTAGSIISLVTTDDGAGGVNFTVTSATEMFYTDTPQGLFTMTNIGGLGNIDALGNITYTPTGRLGSGQFTNAALGSPTWNIDDVSPNASTDYVGFTSGTMSNYEFSDLDGDTIPETWTVAHTVTGASLDNNLNATIVSAGTLGTAWLGFSNTPYTEVWNVTFSEASAVPVPAAIWLFASGLIALTGFTKARRLNT